MVDEEILSETPVVATESSIPINKVEELFSKFVLLTEEGKDKDTVDITERQLTSLVETEEPINIINILKKYFIAQESTHLNEINQMIVAHQDEMTESEVRMKTIYQDKITQTEAACQNEITQIRATCHDKIIRKESAHHNEITKLKAAHQNEMKESEARTQALISHIEKHHTSRTIELERDKIHHQELKGKYEHLKSEHIHLQEDVQYRENEITIVRQCNVTLEKNNNELTQENLRLKMEIDRLKGLKQNTVSGNDEKIVKWNPLTFKR